MDQPMVLDQKRLKVDHEGELRRINEGTRKDVLPMEIEIATVRWRNAPVSRIC